MGQVGEKVKGTMKKTGKRETGCKSAVEWKRDQKKHETFTNSASVLDSYLQLK